jgi:hypothetical protein
MHHRSLGREGLRRDREKHYSSRWGKNDRANNGTRQAKNQNAEMKAPQGAIRQPFQALMKIDQNATNGAMTNRYFLVDRFCRTFFFTGFRCVARGRDASLSAVVSSLGGVNTVNSFSVAENGNVTISSGRNEIDGNMLRTLEKR